MVHVTESVGTAMKGSMKAVAGSGMASMSEAAMLFEPRMLDPSKPKPSSKTSRVSSAIGQLKCCHVPKVSTNFTSTILAPCLRASSRTLWGVAGFPLGDAITLLFWIYDFGFWILDFETRTPRREG